MIKAVIIHKMDQIPTTTFSAPGVDWQPFKEALGRLALEITESAVLACFEPKPISSCYEDELGLVRRKILQARDRKLVRFRDQVKNPALPGGAFVNQEGIYLRFATSCHSSPLFRAGHPGRSS